ncbi:MAG TPA: thiamine pyrophosphate-dependent dehydrogenase E1 component subunit alpha [Terriglobia bacterium]|nr:thiamine pyrophosphate-dependent dehydrogenase E1 component subunit alpha [Terriglobia bacterium]
MGTTRTPDIKTRPARRSKKAASTDGVTHKSPNHPITQWVNYLITRSPDPSTLERMLYYLKVAREAEHRIERVLYRQGKIVGGVYVGRGQEAIAVGATIQLGEGDISFPSHRDFAAWVIRGFTLREIFLNWLGRGNGPSRGRDNTGHFGDVKRGLIPIISPLGDTCPLACGTALVQKQGGQGHVTLVHFGEGTTSRGDVHEAMNMAAVWKLPVIFICNNNAYAYSTSTRQQYAVKDLSVRGPAYGMPGVTTDGNDVLAVYETVRTAIERARAGRGPAFIECKTFRMTGHSAHDAAEYVPKELFEAAAQNDPVARFEKLLLAAKVISAERLGRMDEQITKEIDEAVAFAEASPMPDGAEAVEGVYCEDGCFWSASVVRDQ